MTELTDIRYARLVMERTVERFLQRLFLRDAVFRSLCIVSPFVAAMSESRYSLLNLCRKVEAEHIPTYLITREPTEQYQVEAMDVLSGCPWLEVRYNPSVHAKLYVAWAERETDSFALFGSANLTTQAIESNIELGMMVFGTGPGRGILRDLYYWASVRLRTLDASRLVQPLHKTRR